MLLRFSSPYLKIPAYGILLLLSVSAFSAFIGSLYGDQALRNEKKWLSGAPVDVDEWARADSFLSLARLMTLGSSNFTLAQARVSAWYLFIANPSDDMDAEKVSLEGIVSARADLRGRPYWVESRTVLATLKARHDEVDQEYWQALYVFDTYGRWEDHSMSNAQEAMLIAWAQLSKNEERRVIDLFQRSIHYREKQAHSAFQLGASYGVLPQLCAGTSFSSDFPRYIKSRCISD